MSISQKDLEAASFWDQAVCLDCESIVTASEDDACPNCSSDAVYSATFVLRVASIVGEEE